MTILLEFASWIHVILRKENNNMEVNVLYASSKYERKLIILGFGADGETEITPQVKAIMAHFNKLYNSNEEYNFIKGIMDVYDGDKFVMYTGQEPFAFVGAEFIEEEVCFAYYPYEHTYEQALYDIRNSSIERL